MEPLKPYLTFNGNCREAMQFYQQCLGGELSLQKIADSPFSDNMPEKMKESILHAVLVRDSFILMGSDMVGDEGLLKGNGVSLMVECSSEAEAVERFDKLGAGGDALCPLQESFRGALFGNLTDKYGYQWMIHFENKEKRTKEQREMTAPYSKMRLNIPNSLEIYSSL